MNSKHSLVALLLCVVALPFFAQLSFGTGDSKDIPPRPPDQLTQEIISSLDQEIRQTIDALRETYLMQELNLTEEKAKHVLQRIQEARNVREEYIARSAQIERQLETLVGLAQPDQAQIHETLQTLEATRNQYYRYVLQADQELRILLSPEEQAKYVLFQRNFQRTLQEMIVRIRQHRPHSTVETNSNILLRKEEDESVIRQSD